MALFKSAPSTPSSAPLLVLLLLLVVLQQLGGVAHGLTCAQAYKGCGFKLGLVDRLRTYNLRRGTDRPFSLRLRSKTRGEQVGMVNANGIVVQFVTGGRSIAVTGFGTPRFSRSIFKPMRRPRGSVVGRSNRGAGIGHERLVRQQFGQAKGRCVRIYFTEYQTLRKRGNVVKVIKNVSRFPNKCVVFRTK